MSENGFLLVKEAKIQPEFEIFQAHLKILYSEGQPKKR
jgi:hypothetical protein